MEMVINAIVLMIALFLIERYMYMTKKSALIEREKLINLINELKEKNIDKDIAFTYTYLTLRSVNLNLAFRTLLLVIFYPLIRFFISEQDLKKSQKNFEKYKEVNDEFVVQLMKVNFLAFPISSTIIYILIIIWVLMILLVLIIFGKLKEALSLIDNLSNLLIANTAGRDINKKSSLLNFSI